MEALGAFRPSQTAGDRGQIKALHLAGTGPAAIAKALGCSRIQVYRVLQEG